MKQNAKWLTAVIAIAGALVTVNSAMADVTIDNFQSFTPNALYGSWATPLATITQQPTGWEVSSTGYGSLWKYEGDILGGAGATGVRLTLDIAGDPGVIAGPIVDLVDNNGAWAQFYFYGQTAGNNQVLTADFSALTAPDYIGGGFNFGDIQHIHIEDDPGAFGGTYDVTFRDLSLVTPVPEPTSLTLLGLGALGLMIARRHAR